MVVIRWGEFKEEVKRVSFPLVTEPDNFININKMPRHEKVKSN